MKLPTTFQSLRCCVPLLCLSLVPPTLVAAETFTRLVQLPAPKIAESAEMYPGGNHRPENLVDGNPRTEYSSNGKGTATFIKFEFDSPVSIAAFRHVDRNDPATIETSELVFLDAAGNEVQRARVQHENKRSGQGFAAFPEGITAKSVRWQVVKLGAPHGTVGGAEIVFYGKGGTDATPSAVTLKASPLNLITREAPINQTQPLKVTVDSPYLETAPMLLKVHGLDRVRGQLKFGSQTFELPVKAQLAGQKIKLEIESGGRPLLTQDFALPKVRPMEIYLLPHSHVDIGYTALQADVEKKQNENLETGLRLARQTANYPEGSRFKWNIEVLWPIDNYLRTASPEKRTALLEAIKTGDVGLDAFYGNLLTGLCRPEELLRLMSFAKELERLTGVTVESAMISDVPGYTWSTVTAMAHAGVKYFSFAPNYFDRMGGTMKEWQNRPFYWVGPEGSRVLCWCPSRGYALGHIIGDGEALAKFLPQYLDELETAGYPFDITHLRWNVHGDNGSPDEKIADVVRDWNLKYEYPKLILTTTAKAFRAFEQKYGDKLPEYHGDYTPYWEDGAASSAYETALNRASAERLVQAETLFALRKPQAYPAAQFQDAWRNVLLYSEHTWGAHNSVSQPDEKFVRDQWQVKQAFALDADKLSRQLLAEALATPQGTASAGAVEVLNTTSWERTDLVTLSADFSPAGDRVLGPNGRAVPSQRLSTGELVFVAHDVPAFGSKTYQVVAGEPLRTGSGRALGSRLENKDFEVLVCEETGAVKKLVSRGTGQDLVEPKAATALNDYFYLPGANVKDAQRNGTPRITVKEAGPLVVSLLVESDAPGCRKLSREIRLVEGLDRVEFINTVDKLAVRTKEGLHFGYGFNVPEGQVRMDVGLAAIRPEWDQIPAACKNWFSVQRWVDISNDRFGVTWAPIDAPLVQLGGMTANLIGSQTDYRVWITRLPASQTLYSWVMNNHWHTNYRAEQEGPTVFRFAVRAHRGYRPEEAARFGVACSQPLIPAAASPSTVTRPVVEIENDRVLATALKRSEDGQAWILRLFGAGGTTEQVRLNWKDNAARRVTMSDLGERPGTPVAGAVTVPAWGVVTLRAE